MTVLTRRGQILRNDQEASGSSRTLRIIASTEGVAADNHDIDQDGWVFPASGSVPLVDSHRDSQGIDSVLGRVTDFVVRTVQLASGRKARALLATARFADAGANPKSDVACALYTQGFADAFSVSFTVLDAMPAPDRSYGALNISSAKLSEVSCVAVGADDDARVLGRALTRSPGARTSEDRAAIARAWVAKIRREDRNDFTNQRARSIYERYLTLSSGYGYGVDMAARYSLISPEELRQIISDCAAGSA